MTVVIPPADGRPMSITTRGSVIQAITAVISLAPSVTNQIVSRSPGRIPVTPQTAPVVTLATIKLVITKSIRAGITTSVNCEIAVAAVTNITIVRSPQLGRVGTVNIGSMTEGGNNA